jgi:PAS domain-containing protein
LFHTQQAIADQRKANWLFGIALCLVMLFPAVQYFFVHNNIKTTIAIEEFIRTAGEQRRLATRIAQLADSHMMGTPTPPLTLLYQAIDDMENGQRYLERGLEKLFYDEDKVSLRQVLYEPPFTIHEKVQTFLHQAEIVATLYGEERDKTNPSYLYVSDKAATTLQTDLEGLQIAYSHIAERQKQSLYQASTFLFIGTIIALLYIGLFLFHPLVRRISTSMRHVDLLQKIAVAANQAKTMEEGLRVALAAVANHTGWQVGHAYLYHGLSGTLRSVPVWVIPDHPRYEDFQKETAAAFYKPGEDLVGKVFETGKAAALLNLGTQTDFKRKISAEKAGLISGFAFPVVIGTYPVAVLEFYSDTPRSLSENFYDTIQSIGHLLGQVIERQQAEQDTALLRTVVTNAHDGVIITKANEENGNQEIIYTNAAFSMITGYDAHEVIGQTQIRKRSALSVQLSPPINLSAVNYSITIKTKRHIGLISALRR